MKMKLFSHTDLDGVGCAIAMKVLFPESEGHLIEPYYCDYNRINDRVEYLLDHPDILNTYDYVFITDISVNEEVAERLEAVNQSDDGPFIQLLDHHPTAMWLNKYEWAHVQVQHYGLSEHKACATTMVTQFFEQRTGFNRQIDYKLHDFAERVRRYDTWEWTTFYNEILPKELNDYLYMIGRQAFAEEMINLLTADTEGPHVYFTSTARSLLDQRQKEIEAYIHKKNKQMTIQKTLTGHNVGVVFAEQHISELGNELCKQNEGIDYVILIDMGDGKVSFRTTRTDLDLGKLAKEVADGGGHAQAAGARINPDKIQDFIQQMFSKEKE